MAKKSNAQVGREVREILADARPLNSTHHSRDATSETTPRHIWESAVLEIAGVGQEDARRYATRERISRAYQMGEPAWMAADMVKQFVTVGRREDRADGEIDAMRRAVRQSIVKR